MADMRPFPKHIYQYIFLMEFGTGNEVKNWRYALEKVANIAGWDLRNRSESPVIEEIVRKIYGQLNSIYSNVHEDCVGLDSRVTEIKNSYLGIGLEDVRFIGIWGMGGMGKTTLARVLHQRIHYHFDASSFIGNVREESCKNGLISLQKQLLDDILIESDIQIRDIPWGINMIKDRLCKKKVLITLDDVDQLDQLNALAGKRDWFGQGSRIIITTRDKHLLIKHGMTKAEIYNIMKLEENEALKLFSREVFKKDYPPKDFMKMSQNFIHYADGLPLALKVLGANLMKREPVDWKDILDNLKEDPPSQLMGVFEISFNGLYSKQKNVFLDIACFFNGFNKDWVANILQTSIEIDVLVEKSLIEVSRFGNLWIHDTLQDFGREIVRRKYPDEHGQRSRLWLSDDIFHVLKHDTGTEKVKGIFLSSSFIEEKEVHLNAKVFSKMINLRLLQIDHVHLPRESFHPNKLIELIMHAGSLKQLWKGIKSSKMLKHIDLSYSKDLIKIPDLTEVPNLEKLILKGCTSLSKIHTSLGYLEKLILLDLDGCVCLKSLPCKINSECLVIDLNGCLRLKNFPEIVGNMSRLPLLDLAGTAIEGLPLSIKHLTDLTLLSLRDCKFLLSLPDTICCLTSLTTLTLSGCSRLNKLPTNLGNLVCLDNLGVIGIAISELPSSVEHLTRLTSLNLSDCKDLLSLPDTICSMTYLKEPILSGCSTLHRLPKNLGNLTGLKELDVNKTAIRELPSSLEHLSNLTSLNLSDCKELLSIPNATCNITNIKTLFLSGCSKLEDLPENIGNLIGLKKLEIGTAVREPPSSIFLIKNLEVLCFHGCEGTLSTQSPNPVRLELPSLSCLRSLVKLELRDCNLRAVPNDIDSLHLLENLNLSENNFVCLPESIIRLSKLKVIYIENCTSLRSLPQIPLSTRSIWANGCTSLETLPNQLKQESFFEPNVYLLNCFKLADNQGFSDKFLTLLSCYFQEQRVMISLFLEENFQNGLAIKVQGLQ
nr:tmv resistance protein n [Quercus suber]